MPEKSISYTKVYKRYDDLCIDLFLYLLMFFKKNTLLFFLSFYVFNGISQNPKAIDTLEIHNQIKSFGINEKTFDFKNHFFSDIVYKNDSTLYYNPNSTLDLFKINLSDIPRVFKISEEINSGGYYNRHLFLFNDILYSYGGKGLLNTFSGLIYFDYPSKKWIKKEIKNYPFDAKKVLNSWVIGNKIMVLLNHFSEFETSEIDTQMQLSFGEIDLDKFKYTQTNSFKKTSPELLLKQYKLGFFRGNYIYDSDLYSLHGYIEEYGDFKYRVLDKVLGSFRSTTKLDKLKSVDGFSYVYIKESRVYYRDHNGNIESFDVNSGEIKNKKEYFKLYKPKTKKNSPYYIVIILIIICLLIFYFIRIKKVNTINTLPDNLKQEILIIINKLNDQKSNAISKDKLDEIFGIKHLSYESIKTKRSFFINLINIHTKKKIERVRDKKDKRSYIYRIS